MKRLILAATIVLIASTVAIAQEPIAQFDTIVSPAIQKKLGIDTWNQEKRDELRSVIMRYHIDREIKRTIQVWNGDEQVLKEEHARIDRHLANQIRTTMLFIKDPISEEQRLRVVGFLEEKLAILEGKKDAKPE